MNQTHSIYYHKDQYENERVKFESLYESSGFPTRSDTNQPVKSQKQARGLKIRIKEEEELYYP